MNLQEFSQKCKPLVILAFALAARFAHIRETHAPEEKNYGAKRRTVYGAKVPSK
jgi:hypothetical protein